MHAIRSSKFALCGCAILKHNFHHMHDQFSEFVHIFALELSAVTVESTADASAIAVQSAVLLVTG